MNRRALWAGIGVFFVLAVGTGYLPDLRLASELRGARGEGLLDLPAPSAQDGRKRFQNVLGAHLPAATHIRVHSYRRGKFENASMVRYLDDVLAASRLPVGGQALEDPFEGPIGPALPRAWTHIDANPDEHLLVAVQELAARAKSGRDLAAAAGVARLFAVEENVRAGEYWLEAADAVLTRAGKIGVAPSAVWEALGEPPEPRRVLQRRFARIVDLVEGGRVQGARSWARAFNRKGDEIRFVRFWRAFFRKAPPSGGRFSEALRGAEAGIEANDRLFKPYVAPVTGRAPSSWAGWAARMEQARERWRAAR